VKKIVAVQEEPWLLITIECMLYQSITRPLKVIALILFLNLV